MEKIIDRLMNKKVNIRCSPIYLCKACHQECLLFVMFVSEVFIYYILKMSKCKDKNIHWSVKFVLKRHLIVAE